MQNQSFLFPNSFKTNYGYTPHSKHQQKTTSIHIQPTYTHITHTHTNTIHHTKCLLAKTMAFPIKKSTIDTPTNGIIRTCKTILSLSPSFQEQLKEYTTQQTPTHNLKHCHTFHKPGCRCSVEHLTMWVMTKAAEV